MNNPEGYGDGFQDNGVERRAKIEEMHLMPGHVHMPSLFHPSMEWLKRFEYIKKRRAVDKLPGPTANFLNDAVF